MQDKISKERIIAYIDGFNLYFGLRAKGFDDYRWLNPYKLVLNMLKESQELISVKYFTSRVSNNQEKQKRQNIYLDAIDSTKTEIYYGHYQRNIAECLSCNNKWYNYNEKKTDVNIASQLLKDAFLDKFDCAFLISGDTDLVPPIEIINEFISNKRVLVAFPPKRSNEQLKIVSKGNLVIGRKILKASQFTSKVKLASGWEVYRPKEWNSK